MSKHSEQEEECWRYPNYGTEIAINDSGTKTEICNKVIN
jgi:hypothetical protein